MRFNVSGQIENIILCLRIFKAYLFVISDNIGALARRVRCITKTYTIICRHFYVNLYSRKSTYQFNQYSYIFDLGLKVN